MMEAYEPDALDNDFFVSKHRDTHPLSISDR